MTGTQFQLRNPAISIYSHDLEHLAAFYKRLGFRETCRTPNEAPALVVLELDEFKLGITSVEADARRDRALDRRRRPRPRQLTTDGALSISRPHDFLAGRLRAAWIADPDGSAIQLVQRR